MRGFADQRHWSAGWTQSFPDSVLAGHLVRHAVDGFLYLALGLVGLSLGLQIAVVREIASGFLDPALHSIDVAHQVAPFVAVAFHLPSIARRNPKPPETLPRQASDSSSTCARAPLRAGQMASSWWSEATKSR